MSEASKVGHVTSKRSLSHSEHFLGDKAKLVVATMV